MKSFESHPFSIKPLQTKQAGAFYQIHDGHHQIDLSKEDYQIFSSLQTGMSIENLVLHFLKNGWIVSFQRIYSVLMGLYKNNWILTDSINQHVHDYEQKNTSSTIWQKLKESVWSEEESEMQSPPSQVLQLPFFRSLQPEIQKFFLLGAQTAQVQAQVAICHVGDKSRNLYVLLSGRVGIFRKSPQGQNQCITTLSAGSVFGEGGYFLDRPRSADVVTLEPCEIMKIPHSPSRFDELIKSPKAQDLQFRIWILNGLLSSPVFQKLPSETFDSLVFLGSPLSFKKGQVICSEGQIGDRFYIIVQGSLGAFQKGQKINTMGAGTPFGEVALLVNQGVRTATVSAESDGVLLEITAQKFFHFLAQNFFLALEIERIAWARWQADQKR